VLQAVPGVQAVRVQSAAEGRYQYALQAEERATPAVSRAVHEAGFNLYGLLREQRTLEALFAEVAAGSAQEGMEVARAA